MSEATVTRADRRAVPGDPTAALRGVARGGTANLLGAVVTGVAQFALTVVIARLLQPSAAGVFFATTSLFLLAVIVGNLGANVGLVYFLSRSRALGATELIPGYLAAALRPVLVVSVAIGATLFALAPPLAALIVPDQTGLGTTLLRAVSLMVPLASLENVALAGTRGLGTMRPNLVVALAGRPVGQLLLVTAALLLGDSLGWVGAGWALVYLPSAAVALWWLRRLARRVAAEDGATGTASAAPAEPVTRAFWRFSSARALTSILQIAMQRLDIVLVGALAGAGAAAVFTAASRFVVVGQTLGTALGNASDPRIAASMAGGDTRAVRDIYQTSTAWLVALTWPMFLLLVVLREPLLAVFGSAYAGAGSTLVVLSLAMLVSTLSGTVDSVIVMAGHTSWNLLNAAVAATVMFGLDLLLIPRWGVFGAAVGWACAIVIRNLVGLGQVGFAMRLHPFGPATLLIVVLNLAVFLGLPALSRPLLGDGPAALATGCTVAVLVYAAGLWALRRPLQLRAMLAARSRPSR